MTAAKNKYKIFIYNDNLITLIQIIKPYLHGSMIYKFNFSSSKGKGEEISQVKKADSCFLNFVPPTTPNLPLVNRSERIKNQKVELNRFTLHSPLFPRPAPLQEGAKAKRKFSTSTFLYKSSPWPAPASKNKMYFIFCGTWRQWLKLKK